MGMVVWWDDLTCHIRISVLVKLSKQQTNLEDVFLVLALR
jgi:hypothetical protein